MFSLSKLRALDVDSIGDIIKKRGDSASSVEDVANTITDYIYNNFLEKDVRDIVLVRFFITHEFGLLPIALKSIVEKNNITQKKDLHDNTKCMVLLATHGDKRQWNSRTSSVGHQAIPLFSNDFIKSFPMISELFRQFGVKTSEILGKNKSTTIKDRLKLYNAFYVDNAQGHPSVPAQDDFVKPFGIKSVVGFGGVLPANNVFSVIMFCRTEVPKEVAKLFSALSLKINLAILPLYNKKIFNSKNDKDSSCLTKEMCALQESVDVMDWIANKISAKKEGQKV